MQIDSVSSKLVQLALYLESKLPGMVSEVWIDESTVKQLKDPLPQTSEELKTLIQALQTEIKEIKDSHRQQYLTAITGSVIFQIEKMNQPVSYSEFTQNTFSFKIERVSESTLRLIEDEIRKLEKEIGQTRQEIYHSLTVPSANYKTEFQNFIPEIKNSIPDQFLQFNDQGFVFEVTNDKPWSAFNSHIAPYKSVLTLNADIPFTLIDLHHLASHEAYGGHHTELSNKDKLLVNEGRGEHGLVITFSPQTFISEAIAEGMYVLLNIRKQDPRYLIGWYYDRLTFALQNYATFLFVDEKLTRDQIDKKLQSFYISDKTRNYILNFSTDPIFCRYAPVYYSAFNFISDLYSKTPNKEELITTLFTKPCTTDLLTAEFLS